MKKVMYCPTVSGLNAIERTAKENIPIAKVFHINASNTKALYGKGLRSASIGDPYTNRQVGELQIDIKTDIGYPDFEKPKLSFLSKFKKTKLTGNWIMCVDYPWEDVMKEPGNIGYITTPLGKKATSYLRDVQTSGSASSIGEYVVLYGYIPKGSTYYELDRESSYYKELSRYATNRIILYPYNVQLMFNQLTGYDNVCELAKK